jgi:hypothetical protein
MSGTITESEVYSPSVTSIEDGDDASGAIATAPLQQLANRTKYLKGQLDAGALKIREAATVAALKAVTGQATGDVRLVPGLGPFRFDSAATATADDLFVITPTVGGGRWLRLDHGMRTSDLGGLATMTGLTVGDLVMVPGVGIYRYTADTPATKGIWLRPATAMGGLFTNVMYGIVDPANGWDGLQYRIDPLAAPVPNRIVSISEVTPTSGSFAPATTSPGAAFGPTLTIDVEEGDVVEIEGQIALLEDNSATITIVMRSGSGILGNGKAMIKATGVMPVHIYTRHVVTSSGSFPIRFSGICSSTGSTTFTEAGIVARVIRP